jgi:hypothetical protein
VHEFIESVKDEFRHKEPLLFFRFFALWRLFSVFLSILLRLLLLLAIVAVLEVIFDLESVFVITLLESVHDSDCRVDLGQRLLHLALEYLRGLEKVPALIYKIYVFVIV